MPSLAVWFDVAVGAVCVAAAVLSALLQKMRPQQAWRIAWSPWSSVLFVALGLCAWFAAAASVASGSAAQIWHLLLYVSGWVALGSAIAALVRYATSRR